MFSTSATRGRIISRKEPPKAPEEMSRDMYGFQVQPQYAEKYRRYARIYQVEEEERSERWEEFLRSVDSDEINAGQGSEEEEEDEEQEEEERGNEGRSGVQSERQKRRGRGGDARFRSQFRPEIQPIERALRGRVVGGSSKKRLMNSRNVGEGREEKERGEAEGQQAAVSSEGQQGRGEEEGEDERSRRLQARGGGGRGGGGWVQGLQERGKRGEEEDEARGRQEESSSSSSSSESDESSREENEGMSLKELESLMLIEMMAMEAEQGERGGGVGWRQGEERDGKSKEREVWQQEEEEEDKGNRSGAQNSGSEENEEKQDVDERESERHGGASQAAEEESQQQQQEEAVEEADSRQHTLKFPFLSKVAWAQELNSLVMGGVPMNLRGEVWQIFVGTKARREEGLYDALLAEAHADCDLGSSSSLAEVYAQLHARDVANSWAVQIEKDLPRTFPGHPALDSIGRDSLRRLLTAYSRKNKAVGYCQGMNFLGGLLLLLMPEENAFWTLTGIVDDYLRGYYSDDMVEAQVDQLVFEELFQQNFPRLGQHMESLGVQTSWIMGPWFLSVYVNVLPWECVLRIWDVMLYEGNRSMLFRAGLSLIEMNSVALMETVDTGDLMASLQSMAAATFDSSQLVLSACVGYMDVDQQLLEELREQHRPKVLVRLEERKQSLKRYKSGKAARLRAEARAALEEMSSTAVAEGEQAGREVTATTAAAAARLCSYDDSMLPSESSLRIQLPSSVTRGRIVQQSSEQIPEGSHGNENCRAESMEDANQQTDSNSPLLEFPPSFHVPNIPPPVSLSRCSSLTRLVFRKPLRSPLPFSASHLPRHLTFSLFPRDAAPLESDESLTANSPRVLHPSHGQTLPPWQTASFRSAHPQDSSSSFSSGAPSSGAVRQQGGAAGEQRSPGAASGSEEGMSRMIERGSRSFGSSVSHLLAGNSPQQQQQRVVSSKSWHASSSSPVLATENGMGADEVDDISMMNEVAWLRQQLLLSLEAQEESAARAAELQSAMLEMAERDNQQYLTVKVEALGREVQVLRRELEQQKERSAAILAEAVSDKEKAMESEISVLLKALAGKEENLRRQVDELEDKIEERNGEVARLKKELLQLQREKKEAMEELVASEQQLETQKNVIEMLAEKNRELHRNSGELEERALTAEGMLKAFLDAQCQDKSGYSTFNASQLRAQVSQAVHAKDDVSQSRGAISTTTEETQPNRNE